MGRPSERTLWYLSSFALVALLIIGFATTRSMSRYAESVYWVSHSQQVEIATEEVRANLNAAQNGCFHYVFGNQPEGLQQLQDAADDLPAQITQLRMLTKDNPAQQSIVASLAPLVQQQIAFLRTSAAMKDKGGSIQLQQEFSASGEDLSRQALTDLQALRAEEQKVGGLRTIISEKTYATQKLVLSISFVVVLLFTILNFVGLMIQLRKRQNAEQVVRRLSGRILQVQDEERRKLSRDLHDGIGQLFAALKMELSQAARSNSLTPRDTKILCDCLELVDEGVNHSRTLSYLLHPPMLDEIGFCAAARWLVQGFSQRSKIAVTFTAPEDLNLPKELELTLFRVLQEGLTNVHRHSGTSTAEVVVSTTQREVALTISDYGKGIPASTLENFKSNKAPTGVGLAGMRGRVADVEGKLELESPGVGTVLRVTIPFEKISQPPTAGGSPTRTVHHVPTEPPLEQRARTSAGLGASNKPS